MPKVFYTTSWKQLFQCGNGRGEHNTVRRWDNLRIIIVGGEPEDNWEESVKEDSKKKKKHQVHSMVGNDGMESIFGRIRSKRFVEFNSGSR